MSGRRYSGVARQSLPYVAFILTGRPCSFSRRSQTRRATLPYSNLRSSFHVATVTGKETDGGDGPIPTRCKSGSLFTCGGLKLRKPLLPDPGTTQIEGMQRIAREKGGSLEIRRTRIAPLGGLPYPG